MLKAIENGEFIEYTVFSGNYCGTSHRAVKDVQDKGGIENVQFLHRRRRSLLLIRFEFARVERSQETTVDILAKNNVILCRH